MHSFVSFFCAFKLQTDKRHHKLFTSTSKLSRIPVRTWWKTKLDFASNVKFFLRAKPKSFVLPHCQLSIDTSVYSDCPFALLNRGHVQYLTPLCLDDHLLLRFQCSFPNTHRVPLFLSLLTSMDRRGETHPLPICSPGLPCNVFTATLAGFVLVFQYLVVGNLR